MLATITDVITCTTVNMYYIPYIYIYIYVIDHSQLLFFKSNSVVWGGGGGGGGGQRTSLKVYTN